MITRLLLKLEGFTGSMDLDSHTLKPVRSRLRSRWHVESPPLLRIGESENPVD